MINLLLPEYSNSLKDDFSKLEFTNYKEMREKAIKMGDYTFYPDQGKMVGMNTERNHDVQIRLTVKNNGSSRFPEIALITAYVNSQTKNLLGKLDRFEKIYWPHRGPLPGKNQIIEEISSLAISQQKRINVARNAQFMFQQFKDLGFQDGLDATLRKGIR